MAANIEPVFALTPRITIAELSVANTSRDGTGTIVDVLSAGTNGTRIDAITIQALQTTSAGMIRLFIGDGVNSYLWKEILVDAITASSTVAAFVSIVAPKQFSDDSGHTDMPLILPLGWILQAATSQAIDFNVIAQGGDF